MVVVPAQCAQELAKTAEKAINIELQAIGNNVWNWLQDKYELTDAYRKRWDYQIETFPQCTWAYVTIKNENQWQAAFKQVNEALAARRNTRDFCQWNTCSLEATKEPFRTRYNLVKDSLSGKEEIIGDENFWKNLKRNSLFNKASGHTYGAMNLIKRLWLHLDDKETSANYLAKALNFMERDVFRSLKIASTPEIADKNETGSYIAVIAMDGDKMGEKITANSSSPQALQQFSATLSDFALNKVRCIVEERDGILVYAGGDDVLALLPASEAIDCAQELRKAFKETGSEFGFEASAGIAVGHFKAPLQMLVKQAQAAEKRAKTKHDRAAIAINVYKRSGEILEWGCKWEKDGALILMKEITRLTREGKLSGRFPYALDALLSPYATANTDTLPESMTGIILKEVEHVVSRQGDGLNTDKTKKLLEMISTYLASCLQIPESNSDSKSSSEIHLQDFLNLFFVETFMNRFSEEG